VAVSNPASSQIVRRELERDPVAIHDSNAISPQFSGHGRQNDSARIDLNGEKPRLELLNDLTQHLDRVFFWQTVLTFPGSRWSGDPYYGLWIAAALICGLETPQASVEWRRLSKRHPVDLV
jgi:hypothetical protein